MTFQCKKQKAQQGMEEMKSFFSTCGPDCVCHNAPVLAHSKCTHDLISSCIWCLLRDCLKLECRKKKKKISLLFGGRLNVLNEMSPNKTQIENCIFQRDYHPRSAVKG